MERAPQLVGACTDITSTRELAEQLRTLNDIGQRVGVAAELDQQKLLQLITDAATQGTGAQFGAFFYNVEDAQGGKLYALHDLGQSIRRTSRSSPCPATRPCSLPHSRVKVRYAARMIRLDPRFGHNAPYEGTPPGHLPRRQLSGSVRQRQGRADDWGIVLRPLPRKEFSANAMRDLAEAIASQASVGLENARLYRAAQRGVGAAPQGRSRT